MTREICRGAFSVRWEGPQRASAVHAGMGYIIGIIILLIVVPLLFMMLSRRTSSPGGIESGNHGVSRDRPSAEEPTPRPGPGVDPHIPPS